ncbi:hypothetical protein PGT21_000644 [Puccinia graminis f. sp. tritici]|uniref:Uncharacterized protein n=1 Tax=Puccinia graminis f. sp. tritici TaxID=56615 RepID=A0A5B0N8T2_PUCGR|nr:hypothetical protein PGT21_000644 [Puccinia graminis f. sp. tritici]
MARHARALSASGSGSALAGSAYALHAHGTWSTAHLGTQAELQTCVGIQACFNPTYCLDPPRGSIAHKYIRESVT